MAGGVASLTVGVAQRVTFPFLASFLQYVFWVS
jgi:hypothetical protein